MSTISTRTKLCAVIGNPVWHSLSPAIHNSAFAALGLDYVYLAFNVTDLSGAISGMRALDNFHGLSVTIPHKESIIPLLDTLEPIAELTGSVNTVKKIKDGKLFGTTTDGPAAIKALRDAGVTLNGAKIAMLGSGGAARAIAFALARKAKPASLAILGIEAQQLSVLVEAVAAKTGVAAMGLPLQQDDSDSKHAITEADIIINCTPVGMHPKEDDAPIPASLLRPEHAVFDIVYTPLETRLLREARQRGCRVIPGVEMFVNQAVLQFELWTGQPAPVSVMREVVLTHLKKS